MRRRNGLKRQGYRRGRPEILRELLKELLLELMATASKEARTRRVTTQLIKQLRPRKPAQS